MGLFSPPHDGFSILDDLCKLLIEKALVPFDVSPSRVILLDDATV
jgi:hypothetical protein